MYNTERKKERKLCRHERLTYILAPKPMPHIVSVLTAEWLAGWLAGRPFSHVLLGGDGMQKRKKKKSYSPLLQIEALLFFFLPSPSLIPLLYL